MSRSAPCPNRVTSNGVATESFSEILLPAKSSPSNRWPTRSALFTFTGSSSDISTRSNIHSYELWKSGKRHPLHHRVSRFPTATADRKLDRINPDTTGGNNLDVQSGAAAERLSPQSSVLVRCDPPA